VQVAVVGSVGLVFVEVGSEVFVAIAIG